MEATAATSPLSLGSIVQLTFSLALIIALIFAVSWVLKRLRLANPRGRGDIAVLAELGVGPRDRVVLLGVGDAQLLIGVGASGIVALSPLTSPIVLPPPATAPAFADKLRDLMQRPGGPA